MANRLLVAGVLLALGLVTAAGAGSTSAAQAPIRLGGVGPLSAPGAYTSGVEMKWSMELAVREVNAAGGVLGRPVELVFEDTRGLPEEGTAAMERLITQKKVVGVVGEYHSSVGLAEAEVAHKYHVPIIFAETWADQITVKGYLEIFRISITSSLYTDVQMAWISAAGFKNVAALVENTDYGLGYLAELTKRFKAMGRPFRSAVVDRTREDFTTELLRLIASTPRPDLFLGSVTGTGSYRMVRQAYDIGFAPAPKTAHYTTIDAVYPEFWKDVGEAGKYVVSSNVGLPESAYNQRTRSFVTAFRQKFNRVPGTPAMEGYDSLMLMVEAIKAARSTNADAIIRALEGIKWTGVQGEYRFPYGSRNPLPTEAPAYMWHQWPDVPVYIYQYTQAGQAPEKASILWPKRWATSQRLYVAPPK